MINMMIERKHNGSNKVIDGIGRLTNLFFYLNFFKNHLLSDGVKENHKIKLNYDDFENEKYQDQNFTFPYLSKKPPMMDGSFKIKSFSIFRLRQ